MYGCKFPYGRKFPYGCKFPYGLAAGSAAATDTAFAVSGILGGIGLDPAEAASAGTAATVATVAGVLNTAVQTSAAARTSQRQQELDEAAMGFETQLTLLELPIAVKQALLEVGALMREAYSNRFEIEALSTALAQAQADEATLRRELSRLTEDLAADRSSLAKRYFADPIHYIRAERELLKADAAFDVAQRWVFFTCRALEYKWQERFSLADAGIGESWDIGSILKARNALELEEIMQKMALFDGARTPVPNQDTTTISFRDHILTPNPRDVNLTFPNNPPAALADPGVRYDAATSTLVSRQEMFRLTLRRLRDTSPDGRIVIPFDTSKLQLLPGFFNGPDYGGLPIVSGDYLDKIKQIAIAVVGQGAGYSALPNTSFKAGGSLTYGGLTYFRSRIPPCPNRLNSTTFVTATDFPGEFIVSPMRYWQSPNFDGQFELFPEQVVSLNMAMISTSPGDSTVRTELLGANNGWIRNDLAERSVAASRWNLTINANQVNVDTIDDIYILITHSKKTRAQVVCP